MKTRTLLVVALLAAPLAGCIENMSDLKDRLAGARTDDVLPPDLNTTTNRTLPGGKNATDVLLPVARIEIYEVGGAKVHPGGTNPDFEAADRKVESALVGDRAYKFVGSTSAAVDERASIASHAWSFSDGTKADGSSVEHVFAAMGGVFEVVLTVKDSKGRIDTQKVTLGVRPALVTVTSDASGSIAAGSPVAHSAIADRYTAATPFEIVSQLDGSDVQHVATTLRLSSASQTAVDMDLRALNSTGGVVGSSTGPGTDEELVLEELPAEAYVAEVLFRVGAQGDWILSIETTYQPVNHAVETFFGGDGHGHAH